MVGEWYFGDEINKENSTAKGNHCKNTFIGIQTPHYRNRSPTDYQVLAEIMDKRREKLGFDDVKQDLVIWFSRKDAGSRHLINRQEAMVRLKSD
jgi:hypothetical protein